MKLILTPLFAAAAIAASAQINSPDADGFIARGRAMYGDGNYAGCIDQLAQLRHFASVLTASQAEEADRLSALAALRASDDGALTLLQAFLSSYPASPYRQEMLMAVGDYYFARFDYAGALKAYGSVAPQAFVSNQVILYRRGYSAMQTGNLQSAKEDFAYLIDNSYNVLKREGDYRPAANFYLGYIAYREHDYATALERFSKTRQDVEPGNAAPFYMAQIYFSDAKYSRALDMALKALQTDTSGEFTAEANRIAGESYYNMGHIEQAIPYLWAYAANSENPLPSTLYILGVSEYDSSNYTNAAALFKKATAATDEKTAQAAWLYLGQTYVHLGNADGALLAFEKAYSASADPAVTETAFYNYIVARTQGGRLPFAKTVSMLEDFLRKFPRSRYATAVLENLVDGYMTDGDWQSALKAIDRIKSPDSAMLAARQRANFELGSREVAASHHDEARTLLLRATDGPDAEISRQARLWLGDCYYAQSEWDRAADAYLQFATSAPENDENAPLAWSNLGYARYKQGRYDDAITDFQRVASLSTNKALVADAQNRIGDCLYQLSDFSGAANAYDKSLSLNPEAGDYALYQISVMNGLAGNRSGQIADIDRLGRDFPSSSLVPASLLDKAEAYAAMGSPDKAISTYRTLIAEYSSSSYARQAYLQLAITELGAGRRDEAVESYKKVIYTFPTSEEARMAADDLKRIFAEEGRLSELKSFLQSVPNSPQLSSSEMDALAFQTAENIYVNTGGTDALDAYLNDYPHGENEAQALYYLADAALDKNPRQALELASEVALNHPDAEVADDAMLIKADAEARLGKSEIALETYRKLEQRAAASRLVLDARLGIMRTALALGRPLEVLVATDKLKASSAAGASANSEVAYCEGAALDRLDRHKEAYSVWATIENDAADRFGAQAAVAHAQSLFDNGKPAEAEKLVNRFINLGTPHDYWQARAFILLSDILRARGDDFESDQYLKALKDNYPGTDADIFQMIDKRLK